MFDEANAKGMLMNNLEIGQDHMLALSTELAKEHQSLKCEVASTDFKSYLEP